MEQLLTIEQSAELCQVSERTIRRAITNGHLEAHRCGEHGALRIKPECLEAWLEARSTLREPRRLKAAPVLPPIGSRAGSTRAPARGRLRLSEHRKAA